MGRDELDRHRTRVRNDRIVSDLAWRWKWPVKAILRTMGERGDRIVHDCGDHRVAVDPSDHGIAWAILNTGQWQRAQFRRAVAILEERGRVATGSTFLDVGANIGTSTIYALLDRHFARAIALEPEPHAFDLLRTNLFLNGMLDRVEVHNLAGGDRPTRLELRLHHRNKGGNSFTPHVVDGSRIVEVEVATVDSLVPPGANIGLVWIDVEGFEPQVVTGAQKLVEAAVPMVIEFNGVEYGEAGRKRFVDGLRRRYSEFAFLSDDRPAFRPISDLEKIDEWGVDVLIL